MKRYLHATSTCESGYRKEKDAEHEQQGNCALNLAIFDLSECVSSDVAPLKYEWLRDRRLVHRRFDLALRQRQYKT